SYHIILSMLTSSPTQANNPFPTRRSSDLHGPNALIDENLPVVVLATRDETDPSSMTRYEKSVSNIKEVKARDGIVISVITEGDQDRKSTRLNTSHGSISSAVFCLKKKTLT